MNLWKILFNKPLVEPEEIVITIREDGTVEFIHDEELAAAFAEEGKVETTRASRIEPCNRFLRFLFRVLRQHVNDKSMIASFTRRWPCNSRADLSPVKGPVLGPFVQRGLALSAERKWINENYLAQAQV